MKIHEYQAKAILAQYNVPVPRGEVAFNVQEAQAAAERKRAAQSIGRKTRCFALIPPGRAICRPSLALP